MEASGRLIPSEFYRAFVAYMPVVCVDLVIREYGGSRILLVLRSNEPLKGQWWVPGGRILKGETALDAARRKAISEVGIDIEPRFIGAYEGRFETSAHSVPTHTVSLVYEAFAKTNEEIRLDGQSEKWKWGELPRKFHDSFSQA